MIQNFTEFIIFANFITKAVDFNMVENIIQILQNHKKEIEQRYSVKRIGIFGSYVRDKQKETSDIDILVEFHNPTFDNFMDLLFYLKDLFGKEVDLITSNSLSPYMKPFIEKEIVWC